MKTKRQKCYDSRIKEIQILVEEKRRRKKIAKERKVRNLKKTKHKMRLECDRILIDKLSFCYENMSKDSTELYKKKDKESRKL